MIAGDYQLKVKNVIRESNDSVTICFKKPWLKKFLYLPGQFLSVIFNIDEKTEIRAYSLNTAPCIDKDIAITVKKTENGLVSKYINDHVKVGDKISVLRPHGEFVFKPDNEKKHLVLVGAGSGITPLMSILKSALYEAKHTDITLVYANRNSKSIIFKQALDYLQQKFPYRLNIMHVLKTPDGKTERYGGRINHAMLEDIFKNRGLKNEEALSAYICGPSGFMDVVSDGMKKLNVPEGNIHFERFTAPKTEKQEAANPGITAVLEVLAGKKRKVSQLTVPPKVNLLNALLDAGYVMPHSCGNGICGSCKTKMLEGNVNMTLNLGLTEEDKSGQYILPCVSYAVTEKIKLLLE